MYLLYPYWRQLVLCGGGGLVSVFVFRKRTSNGLALPPVTGGESRVRNSHGTNPFLPQQLRRWIFILRSPLTSPEVDHLHPFLSSDNRPVTGLVQGRCSCTFFVHLVNHWFFAVVVLWYPSLSSANGRPMDWLFLLSPAADRRCNIVMTPILLRFNNSVSGSLFSVLPSLLRR